MKPMRLERTWVFSSFSENASRFSPSNQISPPSTDAPLGRMPMMARMSVDLPQPDSPTTPRMRPRSSSSPTSSSTRATPSSVRIDTFRPRTESSGIMAPHSSRPPDAGIDEVAQPVAQKVEAHDRDQDGEAGEGRIPPGARQVGAAFGDGEAPVGRRRRRAHAQKPQDGGDQDCEAEADGGAHDHRRQGVGQDMQEDDAAGTGADAAQGIDEQRGRE